MPLTTESVMRHNLIKKKIDSESLKQGEIKS